MDKKKISPRSGLLYKPSKEEVKELIARAREHPLGLGYLKDGAADSVSATFGVHAFVVDGARERLTS